MATNTWLGGARAVAQVVTLTVGSSTSGHTFVTTINGKSYTVTAGGSDTTSTIAAAVQAALAGSAEPEFREVVWTVDGAVVTGTAATPGVPFTVSKSGTGTYTLSTVTASSGPNHADAGANWSLGARPTTGDDVVIDRPIDILWGWDGVSRAAPASVRVKASFQARLGLPRFNPAGYVEYRQRFWDLESAVPVTIGEGDGTGPVRVNLDIDTAAAVVVLRTGAREEPNEPVVNLVGAGSGSVTVASGDVGLAADDDALACTVAAAAVDNDAVLTVGTGAAATTVTQTGGTVRGYGTVTTLTQTGEGVAELYAMPTTVTCDGGTVRLMCGGTATTVTARGQPDGPAVRVECGLDPRAKTFTNCTFTGGAVLDDPDKTVTFTNAGTFDRASLRASDLGSRFTLTRT